MALNYNVGVRFEAFGNLHSRMAALTAAFLLLEGRSNALQRGFLSVGKAGVAMFAGLIAAARDYNNVLAKLETSSFNIAQAHAAMANSLRGGTPFGMAATAGQQMAIAGAFMTPSAGVSQANLKAYQRPITWLQYGMQYSGGAAESMGYEALRAARTAEAYRGYVGASGVAPSLALESRIIRHLPHIAVGRRGAYFSEITSALMDPRFATTPLRNIMRMAAMTATQGGVTPNEIAKFAMGGIQSQEVAQMMNMGLHIGVGNLAAAVGGHPFMLSSATQQGIMKNYVSWSRSHLIPGLERAAGMTPTPVGQLTHAQYATLSKEAGIAFGAQPVLFHMAEAALTMNRFETAVVRATTSVHTMNRASNTVGKTLGTMGAQIGEIGGTIGGDFRSSQVWKLFAEGGLGLTGGILHLMGNKSYGKPITNILSGMSGVSMGLGVAGIGARFGMSALGSGLGAILGVPAALLTGWEIGKLLDKISIVRTSALTVVTGIMGLFNDLKSLVLPAEHIVKGFVSFLSSDASAQTAYSSMGGASASWGGAPSITINVHGNATHGTVRQIGAAVTNALKGATYGAGQHTASPLSGGHGAG